MCGQCLWGVAEWGLEVGLLDKKDFSWFLVDFLCLDSNEGELGIQNGQKPVDGVGGVGRSER